MQSVENVYSKEYLERLEILKLERSLVEDKHKFRMTELEYERDNARRIHEQILERGRIQKAEERKIIELRRQARV